MIRNHTICVSLFLLSFLPQVSAQHMDEIKKQYPQENAVVLANKLHYNISVVDGQPHIESDETEQIAFLTPDAHKYMSSYGFYHSDFSQVIAYEAFTRTASDKKLKVTEFKTKSSKEDFVFYDDSKETTFNFPNVEEGAIGNLHVSRVDAFVETSHPLAEYPQHPVTAQHRAIARNIADRVTFCDLKTIKLERGKFRGWPGNLDSRIFC